MAQCTMPFVVVQEGMNAYKGHRPLKHYAVIKWLILTFTWYDTPVTAWGIDRHI